MGRWRWDKKRTVEESWEISTAFLKEHGYLSGWKAGGLKWTRGESEMGSIGFTVTVQERTGEIRFQYTWGEGKERLDYPVRLEATPCHFGGQRWWFTCPLARDGVGCRRRVGKLYMAGGKYFGCRHCHGLTYRSCQAHDARVDALLKDPAGMIHAGTSKGLGMSLLAIKAWMKWEKRNERRRR